MSAWLRPEEGREAASCGTVGCLAGHIALAAGAPIKHQTRFRSTEFYNVRDLPKQTQRILRNSRFKRKKRIHVQEIAAVILKTPTLLTEQQLNKLSITELDEYYDMFRYTLYDKLFIANAWPDEFEIRYYSASSDAKRARVAVARLKHYLKTGE